MTNNVCAIIVTRNRASLLREAIKAVELQTVQPNALIIIDNGSTDATPDLLANLKCPFELITIRQHNLGGAGGFERGLSEFSKRDETWAWLMDDDGRPAQNALENLQPEQDQAPFWRNCIVLDEANPNRLAFGFGHNGRQIRTLSEAVSGTPPILTCNPFNGTLVHRSLVDEIGLPIGKLFIKGDETEYQERARRNGFETRTYVESHFYHPALRESDISEVEDDRAWVYFYKIRNHRATGHKNGTVKFNIRASARLGADCLKSIVRAVLISRKLRPYSAFRRIIIVVSAVTAAAINSTAQLFISR